MLDFIVIGAQKAGTTSLWQHLRRHPGIEMPESKEEPFFSTAEAVRPDALDAFERAHFAAPKRGLRGKATPPYMLGGEDADVAEIAARIEVALPEVRLVALLRDPVERAFSQWRMSVRQGIEVRSFDAAIEAQLEPQRLAAERRRPTLRDSYVTAGEYGRVLAEYRARFPAERLQVELSADLSRDPGAVLDRVLAFLGLPAGFRPPGLDVRHNRGGRRLDGLGEARLFEFLEREVWPALGERSGPVRERFAEFYEDWSAIPEFPGGGPPPPSAETRARLAQHYAADAALLAELGIEAPWADAVVASGRRAAQPAS